MKELLSTERTEPLIRWAGSKRKLLPWLQNFYSRSGKCDYIEPFCGSACLFLRLESKQATLGDLNKELIDAFQIIRYSPKKLHATLMALPRTPSYYYNLRKKNPENLTKFDRSVRFIYLNRYSFNGLFRTNKNGDFNVPRGTHTGNIPDLFAFLSVAAKFKSTNLICGDFEKVIKYATSNSFVYLDPPYVYSGRRDRGEYGNGSFKIEDLERMQIALRYLDSIGSHFVISYVNQKEINPIKREWNCTPVAVKRQIGGFASRRNVISELLISNF